MRAAIADQLGQPLAYREVPDPVIEPDDVLLEIKACGVCATDIRVLSGGIGVVPTPLIPGHEPVGVVHELGSAVTGVKVGDRVGVHSLLTCGKCANCQAGKEVACLAPGPRLAGIAFAGGYAEFMRIPASNIIPLPDDLEFTDAAPLFCAGLTSYSALKTGDLRAGQRVGIIGMGGLGHMAIPIARAMGAEVIAITSSPDKAEAAQKLGAHHVTGGERTGEDLMRIGGVHLVLNTADSPEPIRQVLPGMLKPSTFVELTSAVGEFLPIPTGMLMALQLKVMGSFYGSRTDMRELIQLATTHGIRPMTETYPLSEVNQVHERLRNNQVRFRAVLVP